MADVYISKGKLAGKGVYATRDFKKGEVVKYYNLRLLSEADFAALPQHEHVFVHSFWNKMYLFPEPSRYTNHSSTPNTRADLQKMCDCAIQDIKRGEMITTNATIEIQSELETFVEAYEKTKTVTDFKWLKGGYRNAVVSYKLPNKGTRRLVLKRIDGNWRIINETNK